MGAEEYLELTSTIRFDVLDFLGSGYVIDHCISALKVKNERKLAVAYITDTLKLMNENLVGALGGRTIESRYMDIIEPKPEETRSAKEIIDGIRSKLRQLGGDNT